MAQRLSLLITGTLRVNPVTGFGAANPNGFSRNASCVEDDRPRPHDVTVRPGPGTATSSRLGSLDVLILSCWCGLAGGLLEVATRVVFRWIDPTKRLYGLSRHYVWLTPLSMLLFFAGAGVFLALATRLWPRRGAWFCTRLIGFWAVLPTLFVAGPRIYAAAWVIVALAITARAGEMVERHAATIRRRLVLSFPMLLAAVVVLATLLFGGDWVKRLRETGRPLPPAGSPNILLIVLDTVRADRLSLYGYGRRTTPALERLAERGIRFDEVRATAPWTLASHASFFSGRWPHEPRRQMAHTSAWELPHAG